MPAKKTDDKKTDDRNVMRHGVHLACGRPNFRHNRCLEAYLRTCDGCDPAKQKATADEASTVEKPGR